MTTENNTLTVDNDLAIFAKSQLTEQIEKASLRAYPSLKIASGMIMPVVTDESYAWKSIIEIVEFDTFGIATVLASGANDGGKVGIFARRMQYTIKTISDYSEVPWQDLQQANVTGTNLSARYAQSLALGMRKKINDIGYNGDPDFGLQGLKTSQLSRGTTATTLAAAANGNAQLSILTNMVSSVSNQSNGLWRPKKLVLPTAQYNLIWDTPRSDGSDKMVAQAFLDAQTQKGGIDDIVEDNTLKGFGENGTDAALVLPYGLDGLQAEQIEQAVLNENEAAAFPLYFSLPLDMVVPPEFKQWSDTIYRERAIARTAGVIVTDPFSAAIFSGV